METVHWIFVFLFTALIGLGFAFIQLNDFKEAKVVFIISFVLAYLEIIMWGWNTSENTLWRIIACCIVGSFITVLLVESLRYTDKKGLEKSPVSNENNLKATSANIETEQDSKDNKKLKEPTFTENIDEVSVNVGKNTVLMTIAQLEKEKLPFPIINIPAVIYSENNKPYVDIDIYTTLPNLSVKLRHNVLLNRPAEWDMNSDEKGLEVINEKKEPVFQLYYKSPSQIFINGVFKTKLGLTIATEKGIRADRKIPQPYPIKPLFKYPSLEFPGERNK